MSAGNLEPGQSDPSAEAETQAIHYSPPDASTATTAANPSDNPPGVAKRRRVTVLGGTAVLAVAAVAGVLAIVGGSGTHPAAASRQDAQISEGSPANGDQPGGGAGQSTSEQGGGAPANGQSATPSALGSAGGPTSQSGSSTGPSTNPAQPNGSSSPGSPGRTSAPTASHSNGNQPTTPPPSTKPPAYAGRLASGAAQSSSASTSVILQTAAASSDNDALLLSVMLTNTHAGTVGASDSAGNSYAVIADQSDGAGDRTLILAALHAKPLGTGGSVTVTFPATREHHVALDDFSGVTAISGHSSATAASGPFASGSVPAPGGGTGTGTGTGIVFAAAGIQGGENATWSGGFTGLPTVLVAPADQLATAYENGGAGSTQASGSCDHQWMAAVVALSR